MERRPAVMLPIAERSRPGERKVMWTGSHHDENNQRFNVKSLAEALPPQRLGLLLQCRPIRFRGVCQQ